MSIQATDWAWGVCTRQDRDSNALLRPSTALVLLRMAWKERDGDALKCPVNTIAADTGLDRSTVMIALRELEGLGLIEVIRRHGSRSEYRFVSGAENRLDLPTSRISRPVGFTDQSEIPTGRIYRQNRSGNPTTPRQYLEAKQQTAQTSPAKRQTPKPRNPRADDPPEAWRHLGALADDGSGNMWPAVNGYFLHLCARDIAEAAHLSPPWQGSWEAMLGWLRDDLDFNRQVLPAIRQVAARPGYKPPDASVRFFDSAVRQFRKQAA